MGRAVHPWALVHCPFPQANHPHRANYQGVKDSRIELSRIRRGKRDSIGVNRVRHQAVNTTRQIPERTPKKDILQPLTPITRHVGPAPWHGPLPASKPGIPGMLKTAFPKNSEICHWLPDGFVPVVTGVAVPSAE